MEAIGVGSLTPWGACTDCESDVVSKGHGAGDEDCMKQESEHLRKPGAYPNIYRQNAEINHDGSVVTVI